MVVAVLIAASMGALAIYSFPPSSGGSATNSTLTTGSTSLSSTTSYTTTISNTTHQYTTTIISYVQWFPGEAVNLTLYSPVVQSYVVSAYSYAVPSIGSLPNDSNLVAVTVTVLGSQSVSGNWTTGYVVSYAGNESLNAVVRFSQPSSYTLSSLTVVNYTVSSQNIQFDAQQQQFIQVALTNSTVRTWMGALPVYVASVGTTAGFNGTYKGDYRVELNQVNGPNQIVVFVNGAGTSVVGLYQASMTQSMCFALGGEGGAAPNQQVCFESPWGARFT